MNLIVLILVVILILSVLIILFLTGRLYPRLNFRPSGTRSAAKSTPQEVERLWIAVEIAENTLGVL